MSLDANLFREAFADSERPLTVGLEEELMLLDPATHDLTPRAPEVLERLGDGRFKAELPAAQLEIVGRPAGTVAEATADLHAGRIDLASAAAGIAVPAGAGVHPFADGRGVVSPGARYEGILADYGEGVVRRQLVFGLHVHVALGGPDRVLAVYNALREELPALAALASASPFYEGRDTGLASVRPELSGLLPRQGVPPAFADWDAFAAALGWGGKGGGFADAMWWWELRIHPLHGTLEVRVPDTQATTARTASVAAVVQSLVATLAARHDAGDLPAPAETWRIAENRWSACRHGVTGTWIDAQTGAATPTREHLRALLAGVAGAAERLGCAEELALARAGIDDPELDRARAAGPRAWAATLAERFLAL